MSNKKAAQDCKTLEELGEIVSLDEIKSALAFVEKSRVYHKNAYLKRQDRVKRALSLLKEQEG